MRSPARADGVDDVDFLLAVVDEVDREYGPLPVYVVGYSNGRQMAIRLVHERPDRLAGAVLIGATQPTADIFAVERDQHASLPVVLIHGTRDPMVPYNGGMASLFGFRPRGTGLPHPGPPSTTPPATRSTPGPRSNTCRASRDRERRRWRLTAGVRRAVRASRCTR